MAKYNPTIELEKTLCNQIYTALQGPVVETILKNAKDSSSDEYWRSHMEGHCMKVEKEVLGDFWKLCQEVKEKLGFKGEVDFYVTGDSSLNAFSVAAEEEGQPNIVNVNSAMFDLMNEDEMRFVVGHELGHIINHDTALKRLIYFVFPPEISQTPVTLEYKIRLHDQLAELVADRYGFLANENLNACVTAFYKMSSGLDLEKMGVSIDALLADNRKRLEYFLRDKGLSYYDHPVNPIRVEAINLFATASGQEVLDKGMDELIGILLKVGNSPLDADMATFIATAGLIVANADEKVTEEEINHIITHLSDLQIFPKAFLDEIASKDVVELFNQSIMNILNENPGLRTGMLAYMIALAMTDREISKAEVELIYSIGESMGLSNKEISIQFAALIQQGFVPSLEAIC